MKRCYGCGNKSNKELKCLSKGKKIIEIRWVYKTKKNVKGV